MTVQTPLGPLEALGELNRRQCTALLSGPWAETGVHLGRELLRDPAADRLNAIVTAAEHHASPPRSGTMWDATWEIDERDDGNPKWSNAIRFAVGCRLGLKHAVRLRDLVLEVATPGSLLEFGGGTGTSLLPWVDIAKQLLAVEPAGHFRAIGELVVPEATWAASVDDLWPLTGVVAIQFSHVLNVASLQSNDIEAAINLVAAADEVLVATASNTVRASRIARAEGWISDALVKQGFELTSPFSSVTEPAGWGEHQLAVERWVRS